MALEQVIQQTKFANEHHKMAINVMFTSGWLFQGHAVRLKELGVTPVQRNVLRILRGRHPQQLMLADITCRMIDRSSNATRLVEKLRVKGLVTHEPCATNRRQVDIGITARGLALLKKLDVEVDARVNAQRGISGQEARELNRLLHKVRASTEG